MSFVIVIPLKMASQWIPFVGITRQVVRDETSEDIDGNFSDDSEWELSDHEESNSDEGL